MAMNERQRRILFPSTKQYSKEDYIVTEANHEVWSTIENPEGLWGVKPCDQVLSIIGSKASGKTHLAHIWQQITQAEFIKSLDGIKQLKYPFCILDDAQLIQDQELLHIINFCQEEKIKLLLTFDTKIDRKLADLQSRINAIRYINIQMPSYEMIKVLLTKHCANRSLFVKSNVISYIALRISKDYQKIQSFIEELDNLALDNSKEITVNLAKELLDS